MTFNDLGVIPPILKALKLKGYEQPTPIQQQAIPLILDHNDLLGTAQTGTGKTAAFAIPILQKLSEQEKTNRLHPRALVVAPTRELAIQISENFKAYGANLNTRTTVILGGVKEEPQISELQQGTDIIVATPGRLLDLTRRGLLSLKRIQIFVLDEADHMFDMGFIKDIRQLIAILKKKRQSLFFSATMPKEVIKLAEEVLENPKEIKIAPEQTTAERVEQFLYFVNQRNKINLLIHLLQSESPESVLVFSRTRKRVDKIVHQLESAGIPAAAIHGDKLQSTRQRVLKNFKDRVTNILIATDVAARGIDVSELSHVIIFDLPDSPDAYVHRIGRTGRANAKGIAISFCSNEEKKKLTKIQQLISKEIPVVSEHPFLINKGQNTNHHLTEGTDLTIESHRRKNYFTKLISSTQLEKLEDKVQNETSFEVASLAEKVAKGKCWYPVSMLSIKVWNSSKCVLKFRRTDLDESKHSFRIGTSVRIFNNYIYDQESYQIEGKISEVDSSFMRIAVDKKEYAKYEEERSWLNQDDLAIEVVYNRKAYDRMKMVIKNIKNKPDPSSRNLGNLLIGIGSPARTTLQKGGYDDTMIKKLSLHHPQQDAVRDILCAEDVALIFGPPGTGKTTTIANAIKLIVAAGLGKEKILVTAPSNTAVDVLAIRLHQIGGIDLLRLGNAEKIHPTAIALTLDGKIMNHPDFGLLDGISNTIQHRYAYMRNAKLNKDERQALRAQNRADEAIRDRIAMQMEEQFFESAQVIACTLESTVSQDLRTYYPEKFKYAFVDEAGQAIEPMTWLPISRAKRVVLIGDHRQLPPVVKSVETHEFDLRKSLFEKAMDNGNIKHNLLAIQYRMHEKIMNFSNDFFYDNRLKAYTKNRFHTLAGQEVQQKWNSPFEFLDTCHCGFQENKLLAASTSSIQNVAEGDFLVQHLEQLIGQLNSFNRSLNLSTISIGVITPYRKQLEYLDSKIKESSVVKDFTGKVNTNTIDGFQGQEQDVIYISLVRSNPRQNIGFLKEYRRMNVAITRAKKKVVIIGDSKTLATDPFYEKLIKYAKREKSYFDALKQMKISKPSEIN